MSTSASDILTSLCSPPPQKPRSGRVQARGEYLYAACGERD